MKNKTHIIFFVMSSFTIFLLFNSCCTKKKCNEIMDPISMITFDNYIPEELDTIILTHSNRNTNFITSVDTFFSNESLRGLTLYTNQPTLLDQDYLIKIIGTSQEYKITNFKIEAVGNCNKCYPFSPKSNSTKIVTYEINGTKTSGYIYIKK